MTSTQTNAKTFYATTRIYQGDNQFICDWDFTALTGEADKASAINHLQEAFMEGEDAFVPLDEVGAEIDFHGMTPEKFATLLVENEEAAEQMYGTTWEIETQFEEVTAD